MGALEPWHLVLVLVIVLLLFGPGKLPQVGKAIGDSFRDFKRASSEEPTAADTNTNKVLQAHGGACPNCQALVPAGARFCGACGRNIAAA